MCSAAPQGMNIDLRRAQGSGSYVLRGFSGAPDGRGVLREFPLALPPLRRAAYYVSPWWPGGGNRVEPVVVEDFANLREGGVFLLAELSSGEFLAFLPLAGDQAYCWLASANQGLVLRLGTHGKHPVRGDVPLYSWARARDPYQACYLAWRAAASCPEMRGAFALREEKEYPQVFRYLGWCSWEHYKRNVNEQNMVRAIEDIARSNLPVRYFLVDNGHFDRQSLQPDGAKFPHGYGPLFAKREPDGVRWVGLWYAFLGTNHGISAPGNLGQLAQHMFACPAGVLLPKPTPNAARAFYRFLVGNAKRYGADFLKIDFMVDALPLYAGLVARVPTVGGLPRDTSGAVGNPYAAAAMLFEALESALREERMPLLACNWHNAPCIFRSRHTAVGRCSGDYRVGDRGRAIKHIFASYAVTPWLGQVAWCDHDMFHSSDPVSGEIMAACRALSGGPAYLSDEPRSFREDVVRPLCFEDGLLLRPLAPAAPLPEDLFFRLGDERLFRVVAPLENRCAAVGIYNLPAGKDNAGKTLSTTITAGDYACAPAMVQPYPGRWEVPAEGLFVYDWQRKTGRPLGAGYEVTIAGFGHCLLQLSPIVEGWALVGRVDKYLPAAGVKLLSLSPNEMKLKMLESGPLALWSARGAPRAPGLTFVHLGGGLYRAEMAVGERDKVLAVTR